MKKFLALVLAMMLVLSMSAVALAADETGSDSDSTTTTTDKADASGWTSEAETAAIELKKVYTVTTKEGITSDLYPQETLKFTVVADEANPDTPEITVDDLKVTGSSDQKVVINLPVYDTVGVYVYYITEDDGTSQAVGYTDDTIAVKVYVTYGTNALESNVVVTYPTATANTKLDTFTNTYKVGKLTVTKSVSGNLASKDAYFKMKVTLTSDKIVTSDITVTTGSSTDKNTDTTVTGAKLNDTETNNDLGEWTLNSEGKYTTEVEIWLKDGDTITFYNIPEDVDYTVVEDAQHLLGENETAPDPNSATDEDYTATYTSESGSITAGGTAAASVANAKNTTVATGVVLDSMPYVLIISLVAVAAVAMMKRRSYND